ncbi:MAG: MFS transporter [Geminicoccales bacterium]
MRQNFKVIGLVSGGHFLSHYYILVLPPLFPMLRNELDVSYTALGAALAAFNAVTALIQAPMGFLVDRYGAPEILIGGLMLFGLSMALIGAFPTYPALAFLMAVAGLGNAVFHPGDYAILSSAVEPERLGRAFSIHSFAGYLGFAAAPVTIVFLTGVIGWRTALMASGVVGVAFALLMLMNRAALRKRIRQVDTNPAVAGPQTVKDIRLLLSAPIVMAFLFFVMLALSQGGVMSFGVSALQALYGVPLIEANVPLSAFLFASVIGVLAGGAMADRVGYYERIVAVCLVVGALTIGAVAALAPPLWLVTVLFVIGGFSFGVIASPRDLIVLAVTPPGSSGKVFGLVTTGLNAGNVITPLLFAVTLDSGGPRLVFWLAASFSLLTLVSVAATSALSRKQFHETAH